MKRKEVLRIVASAGNLICFLTLGDKNLALLLPNAWQQRTFGGFWRYICKTFSQKIVLLQVGEKVEYFPVFLDIFDYFYRIIDYAPETSRKKKKKNQLNFKFSFSFFLTAGGGHTDARETVRNTTILSLDPKINTRELLYSITGSSRM